MTADEKAWLIVAAAMRFGARDAAREHDGLESDNAGEKLITYVEDVIAGRITLAGQASAFLPDEHSFQRAA